MLFSYLIKNTLLNLLKLATITAFTLIADNDQTLQRGAFVLIIAIEENKERSDVLETHVPQLDFGPAIGVIVVNVTVMQRRGLRRIVKRDGAGGVGPHLDLVGRLHVLVGAGTLAQQNGVNLGFICERNVDDHLRVGVGDKSGFLGGRQTRSIKERLELVLVRVGLRNVESLGIVEGDAIIEQFVALGDVVFNLLEEFAAAATAGVSRLRRACHRRRRLSGKGRKRCVQRLRVCTDSPVDLGLVMKVNKCGPSKVRKTTKHKKSKWVSTYIEETSYLRAMGWLWSTSTSANLMFLYCSSSFSTSGAIILQGPGQSAIEVFNANLCSLTAP